MERRCVSYNCRGELNSCELNSADHIDHPEDLVDEEGSDYHAAEVCSLGYLFLQFQDEAETSVEVVEFVKPQEILNTTSGEDERVKCHVTTKSELQTVKWTKLNSEVPSLTDGTLQLTNIQDSDAGKYTCIVSVGKLNFVAEMQLNVRGTYRRDM